MLHELLKAAPQGVQYVLDHWQTIGAYSVGGVTLAALARKIEATRGYEELQKFGLFILGLLSTLSVLADYVIQAHAQNPTVLPKNLAFLFSASVVLHKFFVTPVGSKLVNVKSNKVSPFFSAFSTALTQIRAAKQPLNTTAGEAPAQPPSEFTL